MINLFLMFEFLDVLYFSQFLNDYKMNEDQEHLTKSIKAAKFSLFLEILNPPKQKACRVISTPYMLEILVSY